MQRASFPKASVRELDSAVEFEIPPITRCTTCLALDCEGCNRTVERRALAWEMTRGSPLRRLWLTARQSLQAGRVSCLDADNARPGAALSFALVAELLACTSIVAALLCLVTLVFPAGAAFFFSEPSVLLAAFELGAALALFMVFVHALWGLGLELTLWSKGVGFELRRGLTFALYTCGWDLITSPVGLVLSIAQGGLLPGLEQVREAARVPREAVARYAAVTRGAPRERVAAIVRLSFVLPVLATTALLAVLVTAWILGQ
jgi:hypothetical protein